MSASEYVALAKLTLCFWPPLRFRPYDSMSHSAINHVYSQYKTAFVQTSQHVMRTLHLYAQTSIGCRSLQRIDFKLAVLVYRCLHGLTPH